MKLVGKLTAPKALVQRLAQKLGRKGLIGTSVAVVLVITVAGFLMTRGPDDNGHRAPDNSVAQSDDSDAGASEPEAAGSDRSRPDSEHPMNMGQSFGLKPVIGKWRHNEAGEGPWTLTVERSGALHSKESSIPEQLGQIESASGRYYELMIQDPRAGGTAAYTARLSEDGKILELGVGTTKIRKFAKIG